MRSQRFRDLPELSGTFFSFSLLPRKKIEYILFLLFLGFTSP